MKKIIITGLIFLVSGCAPYMHDRDDRRNDRDYPRKDGRSDRYDRDGRRDHNDRRDRDDRQYQPGYK
ncbi:MAG: hypothetical protein HGA57_06260 [Chlorobium limicola]|uniref:hypothetical protein n=1 Tax=Chlorobium limicola TaxID=1092 RepID=UPI00123299FD|nr:hypothetical protein [Chlorobium limicola]NTV20972.1 hypothetical protein [Chlorobium limicola]